ncbi:lipid-A-disaccharide synthase [Halobacteroides halobius DSM 5150]|uniref:Lipid-A-disaccharide synthase n=2 Tax=Halobacteroides TaxID=42417 RepID=L0KAI8_HALHC|nr:lipid-A-disaccharide synthase [Halobacteroides halobius DSM 5150]
MVVAGEASGDMHATKVIKEIKKLNPDVEFFGFGGQQMKQAGVEILYDPTKLSTIGFAEAIKHLKLMYDKLNQLEEAMKERKPDVVFLVDYSGFNMKVAKRAAKLGIPVVNYFAPSAWVWGKWRAKRMAKYGAKIASVFPMEEKVYRKAGADVEFVGHPLLDMVEPQLSYQEFKEEFKLDLTGKVIGLLPGSRQQELDSLLGPMLEAADIISSHFSITNFILPVAETIDQTKIKEKIKDYKVDVQLVTGHSYEVMEVTDLLLVASGTATLEAACLQTPMVIAYQTSWSTYWLGKLLVKLPFIGLPNIISEKEIVPELLQNEVTGSNLAKEVINILDSERKVNQIKKDLANIKAKLGPKNATKQVARLVLDTGGIVI